MRAKLAFNYWYLSWVSIAVVNTETERNLRRKVFILPHRLQFITKGCQPIGQGESWRQKLKQKSLRKDNSPWLAQPTVLDYST